MNLKKKTKNSFSKTYRLRHNEIFPHQRFTMVAINFFLKVNRIPFSFLTKLSQSSGVVQARAPVYSAVCVCRKFSFLKELSVSYMITLTYLAHAPMCWCVYWGELFVLVFLACWLQNTLWPHRKSFQSKGATLQRAWSCCNIYEI